MSAAPAGYSGTPLARKLGIVEELTVVALNPPKNYVALLEPIPAGVRIVERAPRSPAFVHLFATKQVELATHLTRLRQSLAPDGTVWVSWPKKASKVPTDITEDVIREIALPLGFVDVKVCAVDATWSGLKLVVRKALRGR